MLEDRFLQPDPKDFAAGEWSELGSRDMDCIGRMVMRPRERERTSHYNLYRYCHNDPVNRNDPFGLIEDSPENLVKREAMDRIAKEKEGKHDWDQKGRNGAFHERKRKRGQS